MRLPSFSLLVTLVAVLLSLAHDFGLAAANGKKRSGSKLMKNLEKAEKNAQGKPAEQVTAPVTPSPEEEPVVRPGFNVGKALALHFEYPSINGWMTRDQAVNLCEEDTQCGGFTYQGAINGTGSIHFYIAFFRSVLHASLDVPEYFGWTTYSVFREFVFIPGRPLEDLELHHRDANGLPAPPNTRKTRANLKVLTFLGGIDRAREKRNSLSWPFPNSAGFGINPATEEVIVADIYDLVYQDMTDTSWMTFMAIRPEVSLGKISHSRGAVETCCHEDGGMEGLVDDYFTEGNLGKVPEIRCDGTMTREKFSKEVLDQERVVKLIGCGKKSSPELSLSEAIGKVADWRAYILPEHATETKFTTASKLQMLTHLKKGSQFLSRASLSGKEEASFKKVLATPSFLPEHMPNGKNVYVEVGTAKSGLPGQHSTGWDATIQLVSGKQFWYFYPPGASTFRCKVGCSWKTNGLYFAAVDIQSLLPQTMHLDQYGKAMTMAILRPGEQLYIPGGISRVVYNLEESVNIKTDRITTKSFLNPVGLDLFPQDILDKATENPEMVFEEEEDRIKFTTANNQILEARKRAEKGLEAENDEKKDGGLNIAQLMTGSSPKVEEVKF